MSRAVREAQQEARIRVKVVFVGPEKSGKSALIRRWERVNG